MLTRFLPCGIFVIFLLATSCQFVMADEAGKIAWNSNLSEALAESKQTGQPLLLFVMVDNCPYCLKMKRTSFLDDQVTKQIGQSYVATQVNADNYRQYIRDLGVQLFPSTVIISPDNKIIDRINGYLNAQALNRRLLSASQRARIARKP